jgi:predicted MPP superfamily phosphohydrolase
MSLVAAYACVVAWVVLPLHAEGRCQTLTGLLNGLDTLLQVSGRQIARSFGLIPVAHPAWADWSIALGVNGLLYFLAGFVLTLVWQRSVRPRSTETPGEAMPEKTNSSRRRFLQAGVQLVGGSAAAGLGYALLVEPRWFSVSHRVISLRDLPLPLDGLRAVQLTDIHHGPWLSLDYVRQVVQAANDLEPDLVFLTGDYIHRSSAYICPVVGELQQLRPKIATVAVLGNHDWAHDVALLQREFARAGIPLIDNDRRIVTPDRRLVSDAAHGLALCGVGDLWKDWQDYPRALGGLPSEMPRVLLSHNPDVAEEPDLVHRGWRVDLQISGHTHGGQVVMPLLGPPATSSQYGVKYAQGLVEGPVSPVFVCRGIGMSGLPVRIGAPPEVACLEFRSRLA